MGCPLYQTGDGFVPDELVEGAEVFVLGQNPGVDEEKEGKPFVGKTGQKMIETYFPVAKLVRGENVSIGNVIKCRWNNSNNLPSGKTLQESVRHCVREHLYIPPSTRLIVAQGSLAAKTISGDDRLAIEKWRGFLIPNEYKST